MTTITIKIIGNHNGLVRFEATAKRSGKRFPSETLESNAFREFCDSRVTLYEQKVRAGEGIATSKTFVSEQFRKKLNKAKGQQ